MPGAPPVPPERAEVPALGGETADPAPKKGLLARAHAALGDAWRRLRGGALTPFRAAASVGVGLTIGVTPLYGFHLPLVIAACVPLGLDAPIAYLAANISIPIVSPFLLFAEVSLGRALTSAQAAPLTIDALRAQSAAERAHMLASLARELLVGTCVFAPAMGIAGFVLTYVVVRVLRARARPEESTADRAFREAVSRVATRYAEGRRAAYYYVRGKLAGDPVARAVASLAPLGDVLDAGCGRGQLAVLLLELDAASSVRGFDWDAAKVDDARAAAGPLRATFEAGDLRAYPFPACDTALFADVLHYLDDAAQDAVLARAAASARRRVLVRELDPDRGLRSAITSLQERITTGLAYNRGERVRPRPIADLARVLERAGFTTRVEPCWGSTPFANVLLVAERRAADRAS